MFWLVLSFLKFYLQVRSWNFEDKWQLMEIYSGQNFNIFEISAWKWARGVIFVHNNNLWRTLFFIFKILLIQSHQRLICLLIFKREHRTSSFLNCCRCCHCCCKCCCHCWCCVKKLDNLSICQLHWVLALESVFRCALEKLSLWWSFYWIKRNLKNLDSITLVSRISIQGGILTRNK